MTDSANDRETAAHNNPRPLPPGPLAKWPWMTYLLPFVVYMAVASFEPTSPSEPGGSMVGLSIEYRYYPVVYALKIVATLAAMLFVLPGYRTFPLRVSWLAPVAGAVGVVVWIALCNSSWEKATFTALGLGKIADFGQRSGYNPLKELAASPLWAYAFLFVRFVGLAAIVPMIEEFLWRGFVMRIFIATDWHDLPFGKVNWTAIAIGTLLFTVAHPASEWFAAIAWFSLLTALMLRTRNIFDCVVAHAVTNLLLGVYVVWQGEWHLM